MESPTAAARGSLTSGHFVWSHGVFASASDSSKNGLKSRCCNANRAVFRAVQAPPNARLCGAADERIAELERLRLGLTECIGCSCLSLDRCQLANPGDRAARFGPGPRYWIGDPPPR
jgi:hypothetical protein